MATETKTFYPSSHWDENTLVGSGSNLTNALGKGSSNTSTKSEIYPAAANTDSFVRWKFDVSSIPQKAVIDNVSCSYRATTRNVSYTSSANAYLCALNTTKTGASSFLSQTSSVRTLSGGTWTRSELSGVNLLLLWSARQTSATGSINFYGADLTVTYTYQSEKFMLKLGGVYNDVSRTFKKVSGIWVEQTDLANVIEENVMFQNGGEYIAPAKPAAVTITGTGNATYCYATINGTKYNSATSNIEVMPGDVITFGVNGRSSTYYGRITIDGTQALNVTNNTTQTYNWTVPDGVRTISIAMEYNSSTYQRYGRITVTTSSGSSSGGPASIINFDLGGQPGQAEEGMTWGEWVASDYNIWGFAQNSSGNIAIYSGLYIRYNGLLVKANDIIVNGGFYTVE